MQKLIISSLATLLLALCMNLSPLFAQQSPTVKIGIVDIEVILKEMPEAVDADKKLKEIGTKWQDSLIAMKKVFDDKVAQYQKQKSLKTPDQQAKEEEALQNLQVQMMQYQETKFGQNGELNITREKFLDPIRTKVRAAIQKVSKEEKITLVLDKTSTSVLYFDDKLDLTYKVLDNIKRGTN